MYIVGRYIAETDVGPVWDFQGVFSTKEKALDACKDRNFFLAPCNLDVELPVESTEWPDLEYPIEE